MSRYLGVACLLLLLVLLLAVALRQDPGYVLVSWGNTSVEMSLILAAVFWLGSLWLVVKLVAFEGWLVKLWRKDWQRSLGVPARKPKGPG